MRFYNTYGIALLLVLLCVVTALLSDSFLSGYNLENLVRRTALFGIISIGVAFVIVTGGIDLSVGSVVCLAGCSLPWLLVTHQWPLPAALATVLLGSAALGWIHGTLITRLGLQPFIVTLCGLLLYRGLARGLTGDQSVGFGTGHKGLRALAIGQIDLPFIDGFSLPAPCAILVVIALAAGVYLHATVPGRHLFALGHNEEAARYSGIDTRRLTVRSYVVCSSLAGLGGVLFVLDVNSAQPADLGNFYELYAIAAAVLGGFSLRGGEGTIIGVLVGAALMQVLRNMIVLTTRQQHMEFAIIGAVILAGVIADELVKRFARRPQSH
ncbi:MAG: ABC transporter permease [Verrucomicrobiales bacterium]